MRTVWDEFKAFIMRGNVVDLAVGVIIGGAFSTIVKSLVDDLIMPPIGLLLGDVDFADLFIVLKPGAQPLPSDATLAAAQEAGAVTLNYGQFINNVVTFLIVAVAVFAVVRLVNRLHDAAREEEEEEPVAATEKDCPYCLKTIPLKATRCPFCTSELAVET